MACNKLSVVLRETFSRGVVGNNCFKFHQSNFVRQHHISHAGPHGWNTVVRKWFNNSQLKSFILNVNETFSVIAVLFGKQCKSLAVQKIRRTAQIIDLYAKLYDKQQLHQFVKRISSQLTRNKKDRPLVVLFGAALFSWDQNAVSDEEVKSVVDEFRASSKDPSNDANERDQLYLGQGWQKVVDRDKIQVWQRPVPNSHVYEYKVYGTITDVPARAFFDIQVDLSYRRQWDHLLVKVDIVDRDKDSGSEVVQWIQHFPFPMYAREYLFVRRVIVDTENQQLVLMSRGVEHPKCPEKKNYVRVKSYKSNLILRPHTTINENGFDYILTYCDDPQAAIPSVAYSWMASTGVPDYCEKMHNVAKKFHEQQTQRKEDAEETQEPRYNQISAALNSSRQTIKA